MKTTESNTICIPMVRQSLEGALLAGYDIKELLSKSGIPHTLLEQPDASIPLEQFVRLYRFTSGAMNDELVGLLNKPLLLGCFRATALMTVHAGTLDRAFQRAIELHNLFDVSLQLKLEVKGKHAEFIATRKTGQQILNSFAIEFTLSMHYTFICWLANTPIIPSRTKLDYPAPAHRNNYPSVVYREPVLFEQNHNSLQFDSSYLNLPIVQNEASVESFMRRAPLDLYLPLDGGGKVTTEVRNIVNAAFLAADAPPELSVVGEALQSNSHTLRRKLKKEGTSFHTIVAQIRRDIAIHHLGAGELSIENIAYKTGYTEPGSFIRAFKAWTGFTPLHFRKGLEI